VEEVLEADDWLEEHEGKVGSSALVLSGVKLADDGDGASSVGTGVDFTEPFRQQFTDLTFKWSNVNV
jgi:hypothetical protein